MFNSGDRVEVTVDIEVYTAGWTVVPAGTRYRVVSTRPGLVTVEGGADRLTLPARLLRRVGA